MNKAEQRKALVVAVVAARAVGKLMRKHLRSAKAVNSSTQYDIKLEPDVRSQKLIERKLRAGFPKIALLGEESDSGDTGGEYRWVVDPIDGTVNFARGIPHACVSIALQVKSRKSEVRSQRAECGSDVYQSIVGVVNDPFCDELWTAIRGQPARLNGRVVKVSQCRNLDDAIVMIGFAKSRATLNKMLPIFNRVARQSLKVRITGSAALALTYVASGRFDAYVEAGIRLWDIAAGGLIVECAGGEFIAEPTGRGHCFRMLASNGKLRPRLEIPD